MQFTVDLAMFLIAFLIAAASPGPGLAAIVATVFSKGARAAIWFAIGVAFGDLVWLSLSIGGLALIAHKFHLVFLAVKWLGVAYLIYLAWNMWTSPFENRPANSSHTGSSGLVRFLAGLSITMGNPKSMLFYLALLPNIIDLNRISIEQFMALSTSVIAILAMVFSIYIVLASRARQMFASVQSQKIFKRTSAASMAGAAAWIATK